MRNDPLLKRWFKRFNEKYFENSLPDALIFWEPAMVTGDLLGEIRQESGTFIIRIDPSIKFSTALSKLILLHELCHMRIWPTDGHGKKFQNEMLRLASLGAFKNLW